MNKHTKYFGDKEEFYNERKRKQQHLNGGPLPMLDDDEIVAALASLDKPQVVAMLTLFFNLYEEDYKHIWFAKGVRIQKISEILDIVKELQSKQLFSDVNLPDVFTGMGIDDHKRGY